MMKDLMKQIVGVAAAGAWLTGYGLWSMATDPFRWAWRGVLGMSTAMAGEEAGYMLACVFTGLAAMAAMALVPIGLAHLVLGGG